MYTICVAAGRLRVRLATGLQGQDVQTVPLNLHLNDVDQKVMDPQSHKQTLRKIRPYRRDLTEPPPFVASVTGVKGAAPRAQGGGGVAAGLEGSELEDPFFQTTQFTSQYNLESRIAKPIPRPSAGFSSLQHPLLACRQPYLTVAGHGGLGVQGTAAVFPLPGAFPWAHSSRGKPRRGMMRRAVFSDLQRKGLEKRFQLQKYISKPDRKKLAEKLGLKDSQVGCEAVRAPVCLCGCARLTPTHLDGLKSKAIRTIRSPTPRRAPLAPSLTHRLSIYLLDFIGVIEESAFDTMSLYDIHECDTEAITCHRHSALCISVTGLSFTTQGLINLVFPLKHKL
ncbi:hypothetical protein J6590_022950 [Homalodisca vitripennis]|nr:hypothetical protein J6590_022950 [Homalodisca vitripennis]